MPVGTVTLGLATAVVPVRSPVVVILMSTLVSSFLALSSLLGVLPAPAAVAELVVRLALAELLSAAGFGSASFLWLFVLSSAPAPVARAVPPTLAAVPVLHLRGIAELVRATAAAALLGMAAPFVSGAAATLALARSTAAPLTAAVPRFVAMLPGATASMPIRPVVLPGTAVSPFVPPLVGATSLSRLVVLSRTASLRRSAPVLRSAAMLPGFVASGALAATARLAAVSSGLVAVLAGSAASGALAALPGTAVFAARVPRRQAIHLPAEPSAVVVLPPSVSPLSLLASPWLSVLSLASLSLPLPVSAALLAHGLARGPDLVARAAEHALVVLASAAPPAFAPTLVLAAAVPFSGLPVLLAALLAPASTLALLVATPPVTLGSSPSRGPLLAPAVMVPAAPLLVRPFVLPLPFSAALVAALLLAALPLCPLRRSLSPASFVRSHLATWTAVAVALVARASPSAVRSLLRSVRFAPVSSAGGISIRPPLAGLSIVATIADRSSATCLAATPFAVLFLLASVVVVLGHG